jgi:hypothetical protein
MPDIFRQRVLLIALAISGMIHGCHCQKGAPVATIARIRTAPANSIELITLSFSDFASKAWPSSPDSSYVPMTQSDQVALTELTRDLWLGIDAAQRQPAAARAAAIGMRLDYISVEGVRLWLLRDNSAAPQGTGCYIFRDQAPPTDAIMLQAPHVYFDIGTGYIAAAIFVHSSSAKRVHALLGNSAHRYLQSDGSKDKRANNPSDPAHNRNHPMAQVTQSLASAFAMTIVQLHGFDGENHNLSAVDAVVSSGTEASTAASNAVASALATQLGMIVKRFPDDTAELGALSNEQGIAARKANREFIHIELSDAVRDRYRKQRSQAQLLALVVNALPPGAGSAAGPETPIR